ncbi:HU family DNA-binding protein [Edaphobacter sp. 12200R-103]|jgi:integration host factor subunit beta|uniref:HU family DNA-binding protein n=1 Tax=Edaphobacter sp. 12200R-103 TaxID=2703788 RepID=UPI00138CAA17|nr:HU family DNA-binding protein [Edaphobacter sp. 12200R-103]QHS50406.1 integration host factor subunit beta [Edaphobacter sp. 12200R-103]
MTKADLVDKVTSLGDLTRRDGEVIVDTLFESVIGALKSGDKIEIRGFGSFRTRQRNARTGRNPKTGEKVDVPAKRVPYFKPSKELRDMVNPTGVKSSPRAESAEKVDPHHPPAM